MGFLCSPTEAWIALGSGWIAVFYGVPLSLIFTKAYRDFALKHGKDLLAKKFITYQIMGIFLLFFNIFGFGLTFNDDGLMVILVINLAILIYFIFSFLVYLFSKEEMDPVEKKVMLQYYGGSAFTVIGLGILFKIINFVFSGFSIKDVYYYYLSVSDIYIFNFALISILFIMFFLFFKIKEVIRGKVKKLVKSD